MHQYFVYILASKTRRLYIGVTNNLLRRVTEHKEGKTEGFTRKYNINRLVFFDDTNDVYEALQYEKQLKKWNRAWKIELIEKENPEWRDLYHDLF